MFKKHQSSRPPFCSAWCAACAAPSPIHTHNKCTRHKMSRQAQQNQAGWAGRGAAREHEEGGRGQGSRHPSAHRQHAPMASQPAPRLTALYMIFVTRLYTGVTRWGCRAHQEDAPAKQKEQKHSEMAGEIVRSRKTFIHALEN